MKNINLIMIITLLLSFGGCKEDDVDVSRLVDNSVLIPARTATDKWIDENLTTPYNIEAVYRWEDIENNYGKNLVPPQEGYVVDFLTLVKKLFIEVYVEQAGADFFKSLVPKQFLLVGSESYNADGTVTQGTAEGGRKIVLYGVNDSKKPEKIRRFIHVMHHEFGHIMHQTKFYSEDYQKITKSGYTSTWYNSSVQTALGKGFISPYAQLNADEDFVETLAFYVTLTKEEWEKRLSPIANNAEALGHLNQKVELLRSYLKQQWNIDLDKFRDSLSAKINNEVANL